LAILDERDKSVTLVRQVNSVLDAVCRDHLVHKAWTESPALKESQENPDNLALLAPVDLSESQATLDHPVLTERLATRKTENQENPVTPDLLEKLVDQAIPETVDCPVKSAYPAMISKDRQDRTAYLDVMESLASRDLLESPVSPDKKVSPASVSTKWAHLDSPVYLATPENLDVSAHPVSQERLDIPDQRETTVDIALMECLA
jgi:hypothetical protein